MEQKELEQINKTAIMTALKQADIHLVALEYYGEGDSGGIEWVEGYRNGQKVPFSDDLKVTIQTLDYNYQTRINTVIDRTYDLEEAIRMFAYDVIEARHGGWENNSGGRGEMKICVSPGAESVTLEHADYYREETLSEYEI